MSNTIKKDQKIMELLKVMNISRLVAQTSLGDLKLMLRKGEREYNLVLDAVPLEKELNREMMELLFAKEKVPQVKKTLDITYFPGKDTLPTVAHPKRISSVKKKK